MKREFLLTIVTFFLVVNSGNVYSQTGQASHSEALGSVGVGGLSYGLGIAYTSAGAVYSLKQPNSVATSGVAGEGFGFSQIYISRAHGGTAAYSDDDFFISMGAYEKLELIADEPETYNTASNPTLRVKRYPNVNGEDINYWTVKTGNGDTYFFGEGANPESNSNFNTLVYGTSVGTGGGPGTENSCRPYAVSWYISKMQNREGDFIKISYFRDQEKIKYNMSEATQNQGANWISPHPYTKALYPWEAITSLGDKMEVILQQKNSSEWVDLAGYSDESIGQDYRLDEYMEMNNRFYIKEVKNYYQGQYRSKRELTYQLVEGKTGMGNYKRFLTNIVDYNDAGEMLPSTDLYYEGINYTTPYGNLFRGLLKKVQGPSGGYTEYTYQNVNKSELKVVDSTAVDIENLNAYYPDAGKYGELIGRTDNMMFFLDRMNSMLEIVKWNGFRWEEEPPMHVFDVINGDNSPFQKRVYKAEMQGDRLWIFNSWRYQVADPGDHATNMPIHENKQVRSFRYIAGQWEYEYSIGLPAPELEDLYDFQPFGKDLLITYKYKQNTGTPGERAASLKIWRVMPNNEVLQLYQNNSLPFFKDEWNTDGSYGAEQGIHSIFAQELNGHTIVLGDGTRLYVLDGRDGSFDLVPRPGPTASNNPNIYDWEAQQYTYSGNAAAMNKLGNCPMISPEMINGYIFNGTHWLPRNSNWPLKGLYEGKSVYFVQTMPGTSGYPREFALKKRTYYTPTQWKDEELLYPVIPESWFNLNGINFQAGSGYTAILAQENGLIKFTEYLFLNGGQMNFTCYIKKNTNGQYVISPVFKGGALGSVLFSLNCAIETVTVGRGEEAEDIPVYSCNSQTYTTVTPPSWTHHEKLHIMPDGSILNFKYCNGMKLAGPVLYRNNGMGWETEAEAVRFTNVNRDNIHSFIDLDTIDLDFHVLSANKLMFGQNKPRYYEYFGNTHIAFRTPTRKYVDFAFDQFYQPGDYNINYKWNFQLPVLTKLIVFDGEKKAGETNLLYEKGVYTIGGGLPSFNKITTKKGNGTGHTSAFFYNGLWEEWDSDPGVSMDPLVSSNPLIPFGGDNTYIESGLPHLYPNPESNKKLLGKLYKTDAYKEPAQGDPHYGVLLSETRYKHAFSRYTPLFSPDNRIYYRIDLLCDTSRFRESKTWNTYAYDDLGFLKTKTFTAPHQNTITTEYQYFLDTYPQQAMSEWLLTPVTSTTITSSKDNTSSTSTVQWEADFGGRYYPRQTFTNGLPSGVIDQYDSRGRILETTDKFGNKTYYYYGTTGNLFGQGGRYLTATQTAINGKDGSPGGGDDYYSYIYYDAKGRIEKTKAANGIESRMVYDNWDRVKETWYDGVKRTETSITLSRTPGVGGGYNPAMPNKSISIDILSGRKAIVYTDGLGRPLQAHSNDGVNPNYYVTKTDYDQHGWVAKSWLKIEAPTNGLLMDSLAYASLASTQYNNVYPYSTSTYWDDPFQRIKQSTLPGNMPGPFYSRGGGFANSPDATKPGPHTGNSVTLPFEGSINRTTVTYYDGLGQLSVTEQPLGGNSHPRKTLYYYDGMGRLTSVKDPMGLLHNNTYDEKGRLISKTHPDISVPTTYQYEDPVGKLIASTDAYGTSHYFYDEQGRMDSVTVNDRWTAVTVFDDANGYNKGSIKQVKTNTDADNAADITRSYTYTKYGQLETETLQDEVLEYPVTWTYTYDEQYRVKTMVMNTNYFSTPYQYEVFYDSWGRDTLNTCTYNGKTYNLKRTKDFDHRGIAKTVFGVNDKVKTTFNYDILGRLTDINKDNYEAPFKQRLEYYAFGKIKAVDWKTDGSYGETPVDNNLANDKTFRYEYEYDVPGRLSRARFKKDENTDITGNAEYVHDLNNNITVFKQNGDVNPIPFTHTYYPGTNLLKTAFGNGYTYNQAGAMISDTAKGISNIIYDEQGRPREIQMSDNSNVKYGYEGGSRTIKEVGDSKRYYLRNSAGVFFGEIELGPTEFMDLTFTSPVAIDSLKVKTIYGINSRRTENPNDTLTLSVAINENINAEPIELLHGGSQKVDVLRIENRTRTRLAYLNLGGGGMLDEDGYTYWGISGYNGNRELTLRLSADGQQLQTVHTRAYYPYRGDLYQYTVPVTSPPAAYLRPGLIIKDEDNQLAKLKYPLRRQSPWKDEVGVKRPGLGKK